MANQNNLVDSILDSQKKVLDNVVDSAKKFTTGNTVLNETIEKGLEWYKNWLESQKTLFTKVSNAMTPDNSAHTDAAAGETEKSGTPNEFMEQWMSIQANWAKQIWEMSQDAARKFAPGSYSNPFANWTNNNNNPFAGWSNTASNQFANFWSNPNTNPFNVWANTSNPWANAMNQQMNSWMEQSQQYNPFNTDNYKAATDNMASLYNNYYTALNNSFTEWQKHFENATTQDAYKNMVHTAEGFNKFAEMWMPMIKSMQENTFNMDEYRKMMNLDTYKEFMDKFFGFMPEANRTYITRMTNLLNDSMKNANQSGKNYYDQVRDTMNKMTAGGGQVFGNIQTAYNNWNNQVNEAFAPFTKMMTPNQQTRAMQDWKEIMDKIMTYNLKNAELQYMVYTTGARVMDTIAENTAQKVQEGKQVSSIMDLYQEWMNISDKAYVTLFESPDYSALMAEVASLQMKLKKDIEAQTEQMLKDIPVATRSEMDEVYKNLYDLKKQVRRLEKMLDLDGEVISVNGEESAENHEDGEVKKTARKSATKK